MGVSLISALVFWMVVKAVSAPTQGPTRVDYTPWDPDLWQEELDRPTDRERHGNSTEYLIADIVFMYIPMGPEEYSADSPTSAEKNTALIRLKQHLDLPFAYGGSDEKLVLFRNAPHRSEYPPQCSYECTFTSGGVRRSYQIYMRDCSPPKTGHQIVYIYVKGLPEMKSAEDVMARVREMFPVKGELIAEPPFVPNPRTFKIRTKDSKWHFRGGKMTLRQKKGSRETLVEVNALAAVRLGY